MYTPPPGYEDLLADTEGYAPDWDYTALEVPRVGTLRARRPRTPALSWLAMSANPKLKESERMDYLMRFVHAHVHPEDMDEVYAQMIFGDTPGTAVERISRELVTWGTARPYVAVLSLAVMTAHHWRTLRGNLLAAGVTDPLAVGFHALLDYTEKIVRESLAQGEDGEAELNSFDRRLYGPVPGIADDDEPPPPPPGFSPDEVEDSFDAFARAAR